MSANAAVRVKVATAGAFVVGDIYSAWNALPIRFRTNAAWLSSTDIQNRVRQFGATYGANFSEDIKARAMEFLLGSPYGLTDYKAGFPAFATTNTPLAIVGDWSHWVIARRAGMSVEPMGLLQGLTNARPTGQRGMFAWARFGSTTDTDNAFRMLTNVT